MSHKKQSADSQKREISPDKSGNEKSSSLNKKIETLKGGLNTKRNGPGDPKTAQDGLI